VTDAAAILSGIWEWIQSHVGFAPSYRGALFLMAGGLFIIALLVGGILVQSAIVGEVTPAATGGPSARRRRRVETSFIRAPRPRPPPPADLDEKVEIERGRISGRRVIVSNLDDVLDRMIEADLGEPRILATGPTHKLVRFYDRGGCAASRAFERGFLEAALETVLHRPVEAAEVSCARKGAPACEIEVRY